MHMLIHICIMACIVEFRIYVLIWVIACINRIWIRIVMHFTCYLTCLRWFGQHEMCILRAIWRVCVDLDSMRPAFYNSCEVLVFICIGWDVHFIWYLMCLRWFEQHEICFSWCISCRTGHHLLPIDSPWTRISAE